MKITGIEAIPLQCRADPKYTGRARQDIRQSAIVVRIHTESGIIGESYGAHENRYQDRILHAINPHFAPVLMGQELINTESLWETLFAINPDLGNRSIHSLDISNWALVMEAIASIDNALWDALGKIYKLPVYKLIGGFRDRVPVIGIGGYQGMDLSALRDEIQHFQVLQLAGVKIPVSELSVQDDLRRVEAIRTASGDNFIIVVDADESWTLEQAVEFCQAAKEFRLAWIEEPAHWSDPYEGLRLLKERVAISLAAGQGEITRFGCRDLLVRGGVDVLNFDATLGGGITEWRRVANLASQFHARVTHHQSPQIGVHLMAAVPHAAHVEIFPNAEFDPFWANLLLNRPSIQNGNMILPVGPGLGMTLNPEIIERYRVTE